MTNLHCNNDSNIEISGPVVGKRVPVGNCVGEAVGILVLLTGEAVGSGVVGNSVGEGVVGVPVVGEGVGNAVRGGWFGRRVGDEVGDEVGEDVGEVVGELVGESVGEEVGDAVSGSWAHTNDLLSEHALGKNETQSSSTPLEDPTIPCTPPEMDVQSRQFTDVVPSQTEPLLQFREEVKTPAVSRLLSKIPVVHENIVDHVPILTPLLEKISVEVGNP
jgi:hypothetical protein